MSILLRILPALLAALLLVSTPVPALAWGPKGHEVTATIAYRHLSPAARRAVTELLGDGPGPFIEASTWADEVRGQRRETARWHYVNVPITSTAYDARRDCPTGNCVVARITDQLRVAADRQVTRALRVDALKFAIHLIGDLHQPLHVGDNDTRGGNDIWVRLEGRTSNLHALWDTGLVEPLGETAASLSAELASRITEADLRAWRVGTVESWANDAHRIARNFIYPRSRARNTRDRPIILPDSYRAEAAPVIRQQLQKAGVRLAEALNRSFR